MKKFIITPVAAIVMLGVSGIASAETSVNISKQVDISNTVDYRGAAAMVGFVNFNQLGMAVISNEQGSSNNLVGNIRNTNNAKIEDSANGLTGNSGVNVAAGDNNAQANNTALTALGTNSQLLGLGGSSVDAEIASNQYSGVNAVNNQGNHNNANIENGSLSNSAGNLGVNVAAGNSNMQANNFAVSYGESANLAVSTVDNKQFTESNITNNETLLTRREAVNVGVTMVGGAFGGYEGTSVQSNDVYPEIWQGGTASQNHGEGNYWGHLDFDNKSDSGQDGRFEFADKGDISLGLVMVGNVRTYDTVVGRNNINNAVLSGGSLSNAAGNVGVNVASGTNNLQSNSLSLSVGGQF